MHCGKAFSTHGRYWPDGDIGPTQSNVGFGGLGQTWSAHDLRPDFHSQSAVLLHHSAGPLWVGLASDSAAQSRAGQHLALPEDRFCILLPIRRTGSTRSQLTCGMIAKLPLRLRALRQGFQHTRSLLARRRHRPNAKQCRLWRFRANVVCADCRFMYRKRSEVGGSWDAVVQGLGY